MKTSISAWKLIVAFLLSVTLVVSTGEAKDGDEAPRSTRTPSSKSGMQDQASKEDLRRILPNVSAVDFSQMGDAGLLVHIAGRGLPQPEVAHAENSTTILLKEAFWGGEQEDSRVKTVPLVTNLRYEQRERNVVITITTELPISLQSLRGAAPSDSYTLRFVTDDKQRRLKEEPLLTKQPQTLRVPTGPFAVTTPITLDLRDVELRDVFRMLGMHLKKNIIIDQSLPPALVTMTLKNVPLSEAFDYLMKTYDIAYEIVGKDTIVVGTTDGLSRIAGKEEMRAYHIAYADPVAMQALLVNLTKIGADRLVVDPRLRVIYVTSHPAKHEEIAIAIQRLDHPGKQVMIQTRILEFSDKDNKEVTNALNMFYDHWWASYSQGSLGLGFIDDNRRGRPDYTGGEILPGGGVDPTTPMQGTWRMLDAALRASELQDRAKTLANPSIITVDGQEALIDLSTEYPYVSGRDDAGNPTWASKSYGPKLTITPSVGRDGFVSLKMTLSANILTGETTGGLGEKMPLTSQRSVTTNVRTRNGEPFVVGGLFSENTTNGRIRVPILGQLPLLGEMFTYRTKSKTKNQVVMLVIPYILDTPDIGVEHDRVMMKQ